MFSLLTRKKSPSLDNTPAPRRPRTKLLSDLECLETLPHMSDTAVKALAVVNSPDSSLADLEGIIRCDALYAAATLKLANSLVYRGQSEVTELKQAVVRIGFKGAGSLLSGIGIKSLYQGHSQQVQTMCDEILRHSLFTASLASELNRLIGLGLQGEEFTASLLHDIGQLITCVKLAELVEDAGIPKYDQASNQLERERAAFGTDHCSLGSLFAIQNQLPVRIGRVILNHHKPTAEKEYRSLVGLVALSDGIANHVAWCRNIKGFELEDSPGYLALQGTANSERLERIGPALANLVVQSFKATRSLLKSMNT